MSLILASSSPRRSELLRNANIAFTVEPAHVREEPLPEESALDYAQRLARDKAYAVFARHPDDAVLGADTVVVVDEHLLEKPVDEPDAARMLQLLSGRTHQVITGVSLVAPGFAETAAEITQVCFGPLTGRRDCRHTFAAASPWTKPEPTRSRASPRAGSSASKAATSMWWDCRCRGFIECCGPPKRRREEYCYDALKVSDYFFSSVGGLVGLGLFAPF